jgi:hypothetical protein
VRRDGNNGLVLFCREVNDIPVAANRVLSDIQSPANLVDPTCWSTHRFLPLLLFKSESYVVAEVS